MSSPRGRVATVELKQARVAWDKATKGELAFDFSLEAEPDKRRFVPTFDAKDKASVKEAIIRWLDEQL